jgi:ferric-dicitrate binding protein FerR (iron transport regulator)
MSSEEIDQLIRSYEGPEPRPETRAAVMDAARGVRRRRAPAATVQPVSRTPRRKRRWMPALAAAAALLLACAGGWWWSTRRGKCGLGTALRSGLAVVRCGRSISVPKDQALLAGDLVSAPSGGLIALADGSTLKLDDGTELQLAQPGEDQRAKIALKKGRVFLRVSKAPGTFLLAASARVKVLGTIFGVEERSGHTSVGVLKGRVALSSAGSSLELTRGRTGVASASGAPVATADDPNETLRWAREETSFRDKPLSEVLDWISDNSSYRFHITDVRSIERTVTVTVGEEPMRQLIERILSDCGLSYAVEGNDVRLK